MSDQWLTTRHDVAEIPLSVVEQATGEKLTGEPEPEPAEPPEPDTRNPDVVALGKLGASKGGQASAAKLGPKKRSQIAKKAAKARGSPEADAC